MSLISLPNEITSQILSHLPISDLLNVTLTHRILRPLTEEYIYNTLTLLWDTDTISETASQYFQKLHILLTNILRVPQRALWVQHLRVDFSGFFPLLDRPGTLPTRKISCFESCMSWEELELFEKAVERVQFDDGEGKRWRGDLILGFTAAYIRLLLFQFKNLLSLEPGSLVGLPIHNFWRKGAPKAGLPEFPVVREWKVYFGKFQMFRYTSSTEMEGPDGDLWDGPPSSHGDFLEPEVKVMFYSPGVRELEVELIPSRARLFEFWDCGGSNAPPIATRLTSLSISKSFFGTKSLETLFRATPSLEILHIYYPVSARVGATHGHHLDVPGLIKTFEPFRKSLRELKISMVSGFTDGRFERVERPGILGNAKLLKRFGKLEKLDIPLPVLLGWESDGAPNLREVLPENVRTLIFSDDSDKWWRPYHWGDMSVWACLARGLHERVGGPGKLERVVLGRRRGRYLGKTKTGIPGVLWEMKRLANARGVSFGFVREDGAIW